MVTGTNTNPPLFRPRWKDDSWTFGIATDDPRLPAAVGQEEQFNFFVTTADVQIVYNVDRFEP